MPIKAIPFRMKTDGWLLILMCALIGIALNGWQLGLPTGAILIACLLLHEGGHMLTATWLGVPVREFGLCMGGAYVRRAYATTNQDEVLIAVAGPLTNLCLMLPLQFIPHIGNQLALGNLALAVINLLPIPSSDGMHILRSLRNSTASPICMAKS